MTDHLVGVSEIGRMLGVTRQRAVQVISDYSDFPEPTAKLASGRIWERKTVERWMARHPERKPGRRKRSEAARESEGTPE